MPGLGGGREKLRSAAEAIVGASKAKAARTDRAWRNFMAMFPQVGV